MVWFALFVCAIFFAVGVAVTMNPRGWAEGIAASQKRYLGFWAPPDEQIDRPGRFSRDRAEDRVLAMRIVGPACMVIALVAGVVFALSR